MPSAPGKKGFNSPHQSVLTGASLRNGRGGRHRPVREQNRLLVSDKISDTKTRERIWMDKELKAMAWVAAVAVVVGLVAHFIFGLPR